MDTTKRAAAKHSLKAFGLLQASRSLRRAALDFGDVGCGDLATKARAIAKTADDRRRKLMAKGTK